MPDERQAATALGTDLPVLGPKPGHHQRGIPMDDQRQKETKGVPWGDHNETPSTAPDTRREEYGDADPAQNADERAADLSTEQDDGGTSNSDAGSEDQGSSARNRPDENPIYEL